MIMPNFMQSQNIFVDNMNMVGVLKKIDGSIEKINSGSGNINYYEQYLRQIFNITPLGDYSLETFYAGNYVFLGSGTTESTADDYTLESPYAYSDSGLHVISITQAYKPEYKTNRVYTITVRNNSAEDITVSEMGWFCAMSFNGGTQSDSDYYRVMLARDVIESATIKPGEVRAFPMSIEM